MLAMKRQIFSQQQVILALRRDTRLSLVNLFLVTEYLPRLGSYIRQKVKTDYQTRVLIQYCGCHLAAART